MLQQAVFSVTRRTGRPELTVTPTATPDYGSLREGDQLQMAGLRIMLCNFLSSR